MFLEAIKQADNIKFTSEELELLTGINDIKPCLDALLNKNQVAVITLGKEGSIFYSNNKLIKGPSIEIKPVDTTGAGDTFYSYFLYELDRGLDIASTELIKNALLRANVIGGLATQKKGAIDVVPSIEEVENFISNKKIY